MKVVSQGAASASIPRGALVPAWCSATRRKEKVITDGSGWPSGDVQRFHSEWMKGDQPEPAARTSWRGFRQSSARRLRSSRGDKSGTHAAELALVGSRHGRRRRRQGIVVSRIRTGHGGGPQCRLGRQCLRAHRPRHLAVVQDRGDLGIVVEGDQRLFNQYGVILVNPAEGIRTSTRSRARPSSTGSSRRKAEGDRRLPSRSAASNCSSPTPRCRERDVATGERDSTMRKLSARNQLKPR